MRLMSFNNGHDTMLISILALVVFPVKVETYNKLKLTAVPRVEAESHSLFLIHKIICIPTTRKVNKETDKIVKLDVQVLLFC